MATMATYKVPRVENEHNVCMIFLSSSLQADQDCPLETLCQRLARPEGFRERSSFMGGYAGGLPYYQWSGGTVVYSMRGQHEIPFLR